MVDQEQNDNEDLTRADKEITGAEDQIHVADSAVRTKQELFSAQDQLKAQDRSIIAKWIVLLFMGASMSAVLFIFYAIFWVPTGSAYGWEIGAKLMVTILSSVILPVVTLVIGYYFGTETKRE